MKAQVLLPKIFNFPFTYNPGRISLKIGDFVEVPFGSKKEIGIVWRNKNTLSKNIKIKNDLTKHSLSTKVVLDCSKAKKEIKWSPKVSLDNGIRKTLKWYLKNKNSI